MSNENTIGLALLSVQLHEGFRRFPYKDTTGHLTVGYGRNLDKVGITDAEAKLLAANDIRRAYEDLQENCQEIFGLDPVRTAVCIEMVFNLGLRGYMLFRKMRQAIARSDFEDAAAEALDSRWADQVGVRAERLAEQLRTGIVWVPTFTEN